MLDDAVLLLHPRLEAIEQLLCTNRTADERRLHYPLPRFRNKTGVGGEAEVQHGNQSIHQVGRKGLDIKRKGESHNVSGDDDLRGEPCQLHLVRVTEINRRYGGRLDSHFLKHDRVYV